MSEDLMRASVYRPGSQNARKGFRRNIRWFTDFGESANHRQCPHHGELGRQTVCVISGKPDLVADV